MPTSTGRSRRWNTRAKIRTSSRRSRPTSSQRANGISSPGSKTPRTCWRAPTWTSTRFGRVGCLDGGPVMRIEGTYLEFCRLETALLGFSRIATGIATSALEVRRAAPESQVLSFGSRHVHPSLGAVVERSALIGGLDGISNVAAGEIIGKEASGTMPHALLIAFGRGEPGRGLDRLRRGGRARRPRVALCDTYSDEVDESLRAAETIDDLDSVRIDTTGSRRGDFRHILREVRWTLDAHGHDDVGIFASGGSSAQRSCRATSGTSSRVRRRELRQQRRPAGLRARHRRTRRRARGQAREADREEGGVPHARRRPPRRPGRPRGPKDGEALLEPLIRDGKSSGSSTSTRPASEPGKTPSASDSATNGRDHHPGSARP